MATKNCPECSKQVPVACKKCGCGHVFFVTRRSGGSTSSLANRENASSLDDNGGDSMPTSPTEALMGTRRSGRVTRERPNFYDALQYENQTRRGKHEEEEDSRFSNLFVTVGSTQYDELVSLILQNDETISILKQWGTKSVRVQSGKSCKGSISSGTSEKDGIKFEVYDYKPFIVEDLKWADLIICHAGAGTTMEALDLGKPLIVVPNRSLMDDHQLELATKLEEGHHAVLTSIQHFHQDVKQIKKSHFIPLEKKKTEDFIKFLNSIQKQLLRQSKQGKSEDAEENSDAEDIKPSTRTLNPDHKSPVGREKEGTKGANQEPKTKRRRGRPPGITGANRKPSQGQGYKITTGGSGGAGAGRNRRPSGSLGNNGADKSPDSPNSDAAHEAEDKALIATISAEKALQYNIVLQDINTKIGRVSWRGPME